MIKVAKEKESVTALMNAFKSGKEKEIKQAWSDFHDSIAESVKEEFEGLQDTVDSNILAQRGIRQLTSAEKKFYEKLIDSAKSSNPKQALNDLLTVDGGMPETIIEDVYKDLVENHPLLSKVQFQNVKYLTKWLLSDGKIDTAVWGEINAEITKQIQSSFKSIDIVQGKLSAYVLIAKDMLELGPNFLDNYIRTILRESIALGLEYGIVKGKGKKGEPVGLVRDIHKGVSVNEETGYPEKTAVTVTKFTPLEYGKLVAKLVKTESGKTRTFDKVQLLVNPVDYLTKIMPATTVLNTNGSYVNDLFPFPTEVIKTSALSENEAVLCLLPEYFLEIGASKEGVIEYSDDFKFLEDVRTYKTKMFAHGRATDDTVAIKLDITNIDPAYITVQVAGDITTTVDGTVTTQTTPTA